MMSRLSVFPSFRSGMFGIAGLRSFDKLKGADSAQVGAPKGSTR